MVYLIGTKIKCIIVVQKLDIKKPYEIHVDMHKKYKKKHIPYNFLMEFYIWILFACIFIFIFINKIITWHPSLHTSYIISFAKI